jgi:hypothetical protein
MGRNQFMLSSPLAITAILLMLTVSISLYLVTIVSALN